MRDAMGVLFEDQRGDCTIALASRQIDLIAGPDEQTDDEDDHDKPGNDDRQPGQRGPFASEIIFQIIGVHRGKLAPPVYHFVKQGVVWERGFRPCSGKRSLSESAFAPRPENNGSQMRSGPV